MLVVKYQRRIERLVGRMVRDVDLVPDIAQETFIRAYRAMSAVPRRQRVLHLALPDRGQHGEEDADGAQARPAGHRIGPRRARRRGRQSPADNELSDADTPGCGTGEQADRRGSELCDRSVVRRIAAGDHAARNRRSQLRGNRRAHELPDRHRPIADLPGSRGHCRAVAAVARIPGKAIGGDGGATRGSGPGVCRTNLESCDGDGHFDGAPARRALSALADGELAGDAGEAAFRAWRSDPEARRDWHDWHLIGDVLRSEDLASNAASSSISASPCGLAWPPSRSCWRQPQSPNRRRSRLGRSGASSAAGCSFRGGGRLRSGRRHLCGRPERRRPAPVPIALADGAAARRPAMRANRRARRRRRRLRRARGAAGRRAGRRPHDPRRPARSLSRRPQAVRRNIRARRAVGVPAQRHGRRGVALTRRRTNASACRRSVRRSPGRRSPGPRLSAAQSPRRPRRRRRRARCAPGCCASTTPRAGATSRAPSSSAAAAASPAPGSPTSAKGRTSTSASSRSTAGSARCTATTTSSRPSGRRASVAMIEQRGLLSSFPALLQAGDDSIGDWYDVAAEGGDRVAGHEANVLGSAARRLSLRLPALGRQRLGPAAARRCPRRARRRARDFGVLRRRRSASARSPKACCRR